MPGYNGGVIGPANIPSWTTASGVWRPSFIAGRSEPSIYGVYWPPASDPSFSSVSMLCHFQPPLQGTTDIPNVGAGGAFQSHNGAALTSMDTIARRFPSFLACYLTGASGAPYYLSVSDPNYNWGAGDFTIEFWVYLLANTGTITLWDQRPTSTNGFYVNIHTSGTGDVNFFTNSADQISSSGGPLTTSAWHHVALCKASGSTKLFVDGTQVGSTYTDGNTYLQSQIVLGGSGFTLGTNTVNGYYQEVRATKGVGRYTSNFTPTGPYPSY